MLIELVPRRKELRLSVFPCYTLWISLIWGLSYSRGNFSLVPCYFFSKIRWNSCVLVCGQDLLSVILLVFCGRTKYTCVCVLKRNELVSLLFLVYHCWVEDENSKRVYVSVVLEGRGGGELNESEHVTRFTSDVLEAREKNFSQNFVFSRDRFYWYVCFFEVGGCSIN